MVKSVTVDECKRVMNGIGYIEAEKLKDIKTSNSKTRLIIFINPVKFEFFKIYLRNLNNRELEEQLANKKYLIIGYIDITYNKTDKKVIYQYTMNKDIAKVVEAINQRKSIKKEILGQESHSSILQKQAQLIEGAEVQVPSFQIVSLKNLHLIRQALEFATKAHYGQVRLDGVEYITHPQRVSENVERYADSSDLVPLTIASYLHDTIEDTDTNIEDIAKLFGPDIARLVIEVTNDDSMKHKLGKANYLSQKMCKMSSLALTLKLNDRLDNLSDLDTVPPKFREKYIQETLKVMSSLLRKRLLTDTQLLLVSLIVDRISSVLQKSDIRNEDIKKLNFMIKTKQVIVL